MPDPSNIQSAVCLLQSACVKFWRTLDLTQHHKDSFRRWQFFLQIEEDGLDYSQSIGTGIVGSFGCCLGSV